MTLEHGVDVKSGYVDGKDAGYLSARVTLQARRDAMGLVDVKRQEFLDFLDPLQCKTCYDALKRLQNAPQAAQMLPGTDHTYGPLPQPLGAPSVSRTIYQYGPYYFPYGPHQTAQSTLQGLQINVEELAKGFDETGR